MSHNYLFELGTEELPPRALLTLSRALADSLTKQCQEKGLSFSSLASYCTPRRLAVQINDLAEKTPVESVKTWGPPSKIAFDKNGEPTKAALAFCERNQIAKSDIQRESDGKVEKIFCLRQLGGESSDALLPEFISCALANLPIPKRMRWGNQRREFVRPVHWLVMLKDENILPCNILGLDAGRLSRGHRFMSKGTIELSQPKDYVDQLFNEGKVIVDFAARREIIRTQIIDTAKTLGGKAVIDNDLLDEVTALVEWPNALSGQFDKDFLNIPAEALISSMREHQKYFHLIDENNHLLPAFITIANIEAKNPSAIIQGNEKVIRPRLADAAFFFNTDKKTRLDARRDKLKHVVFQEKLGSIFDKTERIKSLVNSICSHLQLPAEDALRASELCKSDLVSNMVYEFPEMQGIAGFHYALNDGENQAVAQAITEHYSPKFAGDSLPESDAGALLALADRIDTIVGIFGIGQKPTGSKDPFALRRASFGVLRILVEGKYKLDLKVLITEAAQNFSTLSNDNVVDDTLAYILDRFKAWYEESAIPGEVFQAVSSRQLSEPLDIHHRVQAVADFYRSDAALPLATANKRVANILAKVKEPIGSEINQSILNEPAESALAHALSTVHRQLNPMFKNSEYGPALTALSELKEPVDTFFDDVMVMVDDINIRNNRLSMLKQLRELFLEIADISFLAPAKN